MREGVSRGGRWRGAPGDGGAPGLRTKLQEYRDRVAPSDLSADMAVAYASAAQILRRVGAHLSNIASTVVQPYARIRHGDEDV